MKPSEHLEYFKEHPHIKKKEIEMKKKREEAVVNRIMSNYGTSYNRPAMLEALDEIEKAISIVDMIESESSKEVSNALQIAYETIYNRFHNR
jgi:NADH:ubiquinone oxidoreductase subunit E